MQDLLDRIRGKNRTHMIRMTLQQQRQIAIANEAKMLLRKLDVATERNENEIN